MRCHYTSFIGSSDLELADRISTLFQDNNICIQDFNRFQFAPGEHLTEIWYYLESDAGFRTYHTYFMGPTSDSITLQAMNFLENVFPNGTGLCYSNRDQLSPSSYLLDLWYSSADEMGGTGGFISFKGTSYLDTTVQVKEFFDRGDGVNEFFQQRTLLGPGNYVIDITYLAD
jgi:hypothetical protein